MKGMFFIFFLASHVAVGQVIKQNPVPDSIAGHFHFPSNKNLFPPGADWKLQMKTDRLADVWSQHLVAAPIYMAEQDHMAVLVPDILRVEHMPNNLAEGLPGAVDPMPNPFPRERLVR